MRNKLRSKFYSFRAYMKALHRTEDLPPEVSSYKWKALSTVAVGTLMISIDFSITNIAFPTLTHAFDKDLTTVMWVTVAYVLVSCSSMLVLGKIGDLIGRKKIYTLGMAIFTVGLAACAVSRGIEQIILFRAFQALGAAMVISSGAAIVAEAFPPREIGKGLGFLGMFVSIGFIVGPVLGGLLIDWFEWRSIFYARAPFGILALVTGIFLLRTDRMAKTAFRLDLLGTLTSSAGIFSLVFGITQIRSLGTSSWLGYTFVGLGLLILALFVFVETRAEDPIVDLLLFKNRIFSSASAGLFLIFVAAPPFILIIPFYLMQGIGLTPSQTGLLLAIHSVTTIVVGPLSGSLSDRFGAAWFATAGATASTLTSLLMLTFNIETSLVRIVLVLILSGVGMGAFQPPNNSTIMAAVARDRLGSASALIATLRQVGISLGMALAGTLYSARLSVYQAELNRAGIGNAAVQAIPPAFHDVLLISVLTGGAVILLSLLTLDTHTAGRPAPPLSPKSG